MSYQSIFSNLFKTYADIQDFTFRKKAVKAIADKKSLEEQEKKKEEAEKQKEQAVEEKKKESLEKRRATMEKKKAAAAESQRIRDLIMNPGEWPPSGAATPSQIAATRAAYHLENGYIERREKSSAINERLAALRESIERKG